jgi:hypothetical protein
MRERVILLLAATLTVLSITPIARPSKEEGYDGAVKLVETHYKVKRKKVPLLARAAIKGGRAAARIASSSIPELSEAGSVRLTVFEDQDFSRPATGVPFMSALRDALSAEWSPLVQLLSPGDNEQTYVYMREAGEKFRLLVVRIGRRDAAVLEIKLRPETLVKLIQDPDVLGKTLADEAGAGAPQ